jgi:hypothetical protein
MASTFTFSNLAGGVDTTGFTPISSPIGAGVLCNAPVSSATQGTDVAGANGTQFVTAIWIPENATITNISYLVGSVGGTNVAVGVLYDSAGNVLANTALTGSPKGTTVGTAAHFQTIALTATYAAKGPGIFYVGISISGNTAKIRCVPADLSNGLYCGSVAQTQGVPAAITPPSSFTADLGPYVFLS